MPTPHPPDPGPVAASGSVPGPVPSAASGVDRGARRAARAALACALGFGAVAFAVHGQVIDYDVPLHRFAVTHRDGATLALASAATRFGETAAGGTLAVLAAALFARGGGRRRVTVAATVMGGYLLGIGARLALNEQLAWPRPPAPDWRYVPGGFSFPSGHTTTATLSLGLLAWAVTRRWLGGSARSRLRAGVWAVAAVTAVAVGWSRVWLGVHWPSDVLAGWLLGAGWLLALRAAEPRLRRLERRVRRGRGAPTADRERAGALR